MVRDCAWKAILDISRLWDPRVINTFGQRAHQRAEVVGLLQLTFADLDDVSEVPPHGAQELLSGGTLTPKEAIERILVIHGLFL